MAIYNYDVRIYDFEDNMIRKVRVLSLIHI